MRDTPRRPNPGDETNETSGIPKASQDNRTGDSTQDKRGQQPGEAENENRQPDPAREPLRRPGAARGVDPKDLQSLLDYRDERARAESRLDRAKQLEYDDRRHRTKSPEPDTPSPATPPGRSSPRDDSPGDGKPRQTGDPTTGSNQAREPLRRPGAVRPVDPKDLQSLLDYRDERARAESRLDRAKRLEYHDRRHRTSAPEPDDPQPANSGSSERPPRPSGDSEQTLQAAGSPPDGSTPAGRRATQTRESSTIPDASASAADQNDTRQRSLDPAADSKSDNSDHRAPHSPASADQAAKGADAREPELIDLVEAGRRAVEKDPGKDRPSNRVRPPREGDTSYVVEDPNDPSNTITDIDLIMGGTLWEIKETTGQNPRTDPDRWAATKVPEKLDKYVQARQHMDGYESAPIGLLFVESGGTEHLRGSVDSAVAAWLRDHPGETVKVRWAP